MEAWLADVARWTALEMQNIELRQEGYETFCADLAADQDLPLDFVESDPWCEFFDDLLGPILCVQTFGQQELVQRVIPKRAAALAKSIKEQMRGRKATLVVGEWMGPDRHRYIGIMAVVKDPGMLSLNPDPTYFLDLVDLERTKAEALPEHVVRIIDDLTNPPSRVDVAAVVTDNAGIMTQLHRDLKMRKPSICNIPDFAHEAERLVLDLLNSPASGLLPAANEADAVINWLCSRTRRLQYVTEERCRFVRGSLPLPILHACGTRWVSYWLAYLRLLQFEATLAHIVIKEACLPLRSPHRILTRWSANEVTRSQTERAVARIRDPSFWTRTRRIVRLLEPMAVVDTLVWSDHLQLHTVALAVFGQLFQRFKRMQQTDEDPAIPILLSRLQARWEQAQPELLFTAAVLHPLIGLRPFPATITPIKAASIVSLVASRDFGVDLPVSDDFVQHIADMQERKGRWSPCEGYELEGLSPKRLYLECGIDRTYPHIFMFAMKIFAVIPSTLAVERLFSGLATTVAKQGAPVGDQTLKHLTTIKMANLLARAPGSSTAPAAPSSRMGSSSSSGSTRRDGGPFGIDSHLDQSTAPGPDWIPAAASSDEEGTVRSASPPPAGAAFVPDLVDVDGIARTLRSHLGEQHPVDDKGSMSIQAAFHGLRISPAATSSGQPGDELLRELQSLETTFDWRSDFWTRPSLATRDYVSGKSLLFQLETDLAQLNEIERLGAAPDDEDGDSAPDARTVGEATATDRPGKRGRADSDGVP